MFRLGKVIAYFQFKESAYNYIAEISRTEISLQTTGLSFQRPYAHFRELIGRVNLGPWYIPTCNSENGSIPLPSGKDHFMFGFPWLPKCKWIFKDQGRCYRGVDVTFEMFSFAIIFKLKNTGQIIIWTEIVYLYFGWNGWFIRWHRTESPQGHPIIQPWTVLLSKIKCPIKKTTTFIKILPNKSKRYMPEEDLACVN